MRILICDDEKSIQTLLRQKTAHFFAAKNIPCEILCCGSGEEVLSLAKQGMTIDLLFLDIQMPGKNGMEIAKILRKNQKDILIIFVTALSEYVYEAFDVNAFHYLVKPFDEEKLYQVLDRAVRQYEGQTDLAKRHDPAQTEQPAGADSPSSSRAILVKRGGLSTKVRLEDIFYAEVFNRKVILHTRNGDIEYYGKLSDLAEQAGADFYRTHRAYLVNLRHVEKYDATTVWLEQGTALISKKQFSGFVRQYMRYLNR
ncbi:MAG: LytTR family DNA-binding domain-containing protein [Bacteroidales bacterium]|nr:LytTR family DNA-binding domain-containing protein [Bacteroidales bacterium]MCM1415173.1 LytTR family DNA-binding domain-containing protein [bacterium]MCM1423367.1 LytTR family DNA-binding domain-containing protein [bacterium]